MQRLRIIPLLASAIACLAVLSGCKGQGARDAGAPVEFANSGVSYAIPRGYLNARYSREQPDVVATYPDFQPAADGGRGCQNWFASAPPGRCTSFSFLISGGKGPTRRQMSENADRTYPAAMKASSVDGGYSTWWLKSAPNAVHFARDDNGRFFYFFCIMELDAAGQRDGVCTDVTPLSDGNSATVLFPYHLRGDAPKIEAGIDKLVSGFRKR